MTKDVFPFSWWAKQGLVVTLALASGISLAGGNSSSLSEAHEGAAAAGLSARPVAGRAYLALPDLKALLGWNAREPQAVGASHVAKASNVARYQVRLSAADARRLRSEVARLEEQRARLGQKLALEKQTQMTRLRHERQTIQKSRLTARVDGDRALSKSLYENVLAETNIDAKAQAELKDFDGDHLIALDFVQNKGERVVNSIRIGSDLVWASNKSLDVAQAR